MERNSTKRGLVTGKSYVVANAIIRANEIEDRVIIDQKDVENLEFMISNRLNYMGINAKFFDDLDTGIFNGEVLCIEDSDDKFYMLIPGVNYEEFKSEYRDMIALTELAQAFKFLDYNDNLLRNPEDVNYLKDKERVLKEFCSQESIVPVKEAKPKQYTRVSEK